MTTIGFELEMVGSRRAVAEIVAGVVGGIVECRNQLRELFRIVDERGLYWEVVDDASIGGDPRLRSELVSPILHETDLPLIESIVAALAAGGMQINTRCGLHVHVGSRDCGFQALTSLVRLVGAAEEPLMRRALEWNADRMTWAFPMGPELVELLLGAMTENAFWFVWYDDDDWELIVDWSNDTRYRGLNLHNHRIYGVIEFRYFNASLDPGRVRMCILLCLGLTESAGFPLEGS